MEINIIDLLSKDKILEVNIDPNIILVGNIRYMYIGGNYEYLDLSNISCYYLFYCNQSGDSIKNHILPYDLKRLYINYMPLLTSIPINLPNSLNYLSCVGTKINQLPKLPNELQYLFCYENNLYELPELPNNLIKISCYNNKINKLPELPDELKILKCYNNNLRELPKLPKEINLLHCDENPLLYLPKLPKNIIFLFKGTIDYIEYNLETRFFNGSDFNININGYDEIINSQSSYNKYMDYILRNKFKSARK